MDAQEVDGKGYLSDEFDVRSGDQLLVEVINEDKYEFGVLE